MQRSFQVEKSIQNALSSVRMTELCEGGIDRSVNISAAVGNLHLSQLIAVQVAGYQQR